MSILRSSAFRWYVLALVGNVVAAWLLAVTGSLLPLALTASASLLCTVALVKRILSRQEATQRGMH